MSIEGDVSGCDDPSDLGLGRWDEEEELGNVQCRTEKVFQSNYPKATLDRPFVFQDWYRQHVDENISCYGEEREDEAVVSIGSKESQDPASFSVDAWYERNILSLRTSSHRLPTLGPSNQQMLILGVNGINTSLQEARLHQVYLQSLVAEDVGIDFIYNHSNSAPVDVLEMLALNYFGFSPNVEHLLKASWEEFHEYNRAYPERKILQICHSQGAIHVYNALSHSSKEITDRLIVLSIAPAKIIPCDFCYLSLKFASKNDLVHLVELLHPSFFSSNEIGASDRLENTLKMREDLILLDPHPEAKGLDHEFESPTFKPILQTYLRAYLLSDVGAFFIS